MIKKIIVLLLVIVCFSSFVFSDDATPDGSVFSCSDDYILCDTFDASMNWSKWSSSNHGLYTTSSGSLEMANAQPTGVDDRLNPISVILDSSIQYCYEVKNVYNEQDIYLQATSNGQYAGSNKVRLNDQEGSSATMVVPANAVSSSDGNNLTSRICRIGSSQYNVSYWVNQVYTGNFASSSDSTLDNDVIPFFFGWTDTGVVHYVRYWEGVASDDPVSASPVYNPVADWLSHPLNGTKNNTLGQTISLNCSYGGTPLLYVSTFNPPTNLIQSSGTSSLTWLVNSSIINATDTYFFMGNCTNDSSTPTYVFNLTYDFNSPLIYHYGNIETDNSTSFNRNTDNIELNVTYSDDLMLFDGVTYIENGSGDRFYYANYSLTGTIDSFTATITNLSVWGYGDYFITHIGRDAHTKNIIPNMKINKKIDSLKFDELLITADGSISTNTIKSKDRYSFEFDYSNFKSKRKYNIKSPYVIHYIPDSLYFGHLVTGNNWIDFESDGVDKFKIKYVSPYEVDIEIDFKYLIDKVKYKSVGYLNVNNVSYEFNINPPPVLLNYTPSNLTPTFQENNTIFFNVSVSDVGDTNFFKWLLDGVTQAYTQFWNWLVPMDGFNLNNPHNITIVINDTSGQQITNTWIVNITNLYLSAFEQLPSSVSWTGDLITITCYANETTDNATIEYRLPDDGSWVELNNTYNATLEGYRSYLTTQINPLWNGFLDFRCTTNAIGFELVQTDYDSVEVVAGNIPPNTTSISPSKGLYDANIRLYCNANDYNNDNLTYEFQANYTNYEGSTSGWVSLYNGSIPFYNWYTLHLPEQSSINVRCNSYDGEDFSDWVSNTNPLSLKHGTSLQLFSNLPNHQYRVNNNLPFTAYCKTPPNNTKINKIWSDCNNDGQWDYAFDYSNYSNDYKVGEGSFVCKFGVAGNYSITTGCLMERINTDISWDRSVCKNIKESDNYCNVAKEYNLEVRNALYKFY